MKIKLFILTMFILFLFTNCPWSSYTGIPYYRSEQETIEPCGTVTIYDKNEIPPKDNREQVVLQKPFLMNMRIINETEKTYEEEILFLYCSDFILKIKERINDYKAIYYVPENVTLAWHQSYYDYGIKKVNYPKYLTLSKNKVKIGDTITITSDKSFFDETTFSEEKLDKLFTLNYYIIWISVNNTEYYNLFGSKLTKDNYQFSSVNNKHPIPKEYYKEITPTSITFEIPPSIRTGEIHIINETCFDTAYYPADNTCDDNVFRKEYVNLDAPNRTKIAFFATKEELVILDESGNEVR